MQGVKKMKLKKGRVAVQVGLASQEFHRFYIPISYLRNPLFIELLDKASEIYGYQARGPLVLPCSVDDFIRTVGDRKMGLKQQAAKINSFLV